MSTTTDESAAAGRKSMDDIMALCKRRGFIYPASEIYGGINGFWDYGPLGAQLKKNLRDAWWQDVVMSPVGADGKPAVGPDGRPVEIVPVDTCIIQNPRVWEASGHLGGFTDPMVQCTAEGCKKLFRADHLWVVEFKNPAEWEEWIRTEKPVANEGMTAYLELQERWDELTQEERKDLHELNNLGSLELRNEPGRYLKGVIASSPQEALQMLELSAQERKTLKKKGYERARVFSADDDMLDMDLVSCPHCAAEGTLTEPRPFNLMFPTVIGATGDWEENKAYLRPETAQGIFINFKNVIDTTRVEPPFGIAQTGKAFRNEVTPRNFTFRSREFEQMEIEFFCHPEEAGEWYRFWRDARFAWWQSIGLAGENLQMREHESDELAHYAKEGAGTADIEYRFPFTAPGFGELEGVADRSTYDLTQHQEHSKQKLQYLDRTRGELAKNGQPKGEWVTPNVIEPSAGLDRGVLALICEAYTPDPDRASGVVMKLHPRIAPIKAAVFPLVKKDGMPEKAGELYWRLAKRFGRLGFIEFDEKQSIGKRYARMDEAGCPYCFTIDGQTMEDGTVTVRDRDTAGQTRMAMDEVAGFLAEKLGV